MNNSIASDKTTLAQKKNNLFIILTAIFLTNAIVAEIIGSKLFALEPIFGLDPAQIYLFGEGPLSFTLTAGVVLWPIVFITTDIINEYFGKQGVRKISILTAILITYVFFALWVATLLPPSPAWTGAYPDLKINESFSAIFVQGMRIIVGSLVAFLIGQFADVLTFQYLRRFTGSKQIWLRATGSTLVSQLIDSFVVLFIAFYNPLSFTQVIAIGLVNYVYKFAIAILLTPLLYIAHGIIDNYLGKTVSEEMVEEAAQTKLF